LKSNSVKEKERGGDVTGVNMREKVRIPVTGGSTRGSNAMYRTRSRIHPYQERDLRGKYRGVCEN